MQIMCGNYHESYVEMNLTGDSHWLLAFGIHPQVRQKEGIFSGNVVLCSFFYRRNVVRDLTP
jgi:hypothetical protein